MIMLLSELSAGTGVVNISHIKCDYAVRRLPDSNWMLCVSCRGASVLKVGDYRDWFIWLECVLTESLESIASYILVFGWYNRS